MKYLAALMSLYALLFLAGNSKHESSTFSALADTTDINPNGSSELALLMRKMNQHVQQAREDVQNGRIPQAYPSEFEKIYSATPTTETTKKEYFNHYADVYISALRSYSKSEQENQKKNYNNLVSACIVCHTTHCPGPLMVIEKLPLD